MNRKQMNWMIRLWIFCMLLLFPGVCAQAAAPKLSESSVTIVKGCDKKLTVSNVAGNTVKWSTSNRNVVAVVKNSNTQVTLKAGSTTGSATIRAQVGSVKTLYCKVTVKACTVNASNGTTLMVGGTTQLSSTQAKLSDFSSSDKSVATVSSTGKVTAKKKGSCNIYLYAGRCRYSIKITVTAKGKAPKLMIGSWKINKGGSDKFVYTTLEAGKTGKLELKNSETGIYNDFVFSVNNKELSQDLKFSSTNPRVLTYADREGEYYAFYSYEDGSTVLQITYKGYTYRVKITISDTNSSQYKQKRNAIYRALNISKSTSKLYSAFKLAAWICDHTTYDDANANANNVSIGINGSYKDYFRRGTVVCAGYADLYMYLCDGLGITCRQVVSDSMDHQWNHVQISGQWYNVDTCWMDSATNGVYCFAYFLTSDSYMKKYSSGEHLAADRLKATGTRFDECIDEQLYLQNEELGRNYTVLYDEYCDYSPWMTGTWRDY